MRNQNLSTTREKLLVGRISYLNIWPLFEMLNHNPISSRVDFISGHPSFLNSGLARGLIHISPSSSFEYLIRSEQYRLLPGLGISARNEVQSVLFCLPFSFDHLESYVAGGGAVRITTASAASTALLKVLWTFYWKLPQPRWIPVAPGQGRGSIEPFLEIGDQALNIYLNQDPDLRIIDLAGEWQKFTGLPFVFALWIVHSRAWKKLKKEIIDLCGLLHMARESLPGKMSELAATCPAPGFQSREIEAYWEKIEFALDPEHLAGLTVYGNYLTRLEMIPGMPVLDFI
ncbi:menaquinone biosynthesis protein [Desulfonatronovibrio hydrogenovorans]|uniref:menaquinone biosynthesis protein n=1 Tax=Desulfonatronovibrio hydrogenovorans TaxID=53245 RepID=UPI00069253E9|nr:menaquinone biosynthesis protein [Desulfonatronovibrio hydrogenovorans]